LILTKQLRFLALTVLVLIAVLWGLGGTIRSSDPLGLWLMIAGLPTGVVLLLNARRLRSVGPIVFAATLLLFSTIVAGVCYGAFFASDFIGPVHFVREDLERLPFPTAVSGFCRQPDRASRIL
jgi:energy-converting hydrogenase Eha subunit C